MLLKDIGVHAELNARQKGSNEPVTVFPANTSDDVYIDEDGNTLTDGLPVVVKTVDPDTDEVVGYFSCREEESIEITDVNLLNALTTPITEMATISE